MHDSQSHDTARVANTLTFSLPELHMSIHGCYRILSEAPTRRPVFSGGYCITTVITALFYGPGRVLKVVSGGGQQRLLEIVVKEASPF